MISLSAAAVHTCGSVVWDWDLVNGGLRGLGASGEAWAREDPFEMQSPFRAIRGFRTCIVCNSGLKGAQVGCDGLGRGKAREGALRCRTPGYPPLRAGPGRKSYPGRPACEWGPDTGPGLGPYLSRRSLGGSLGGGSGLRSLSPPRSGRQSGGSLGSAPPREPRNGGVGSRSSPRGWWLKSGAGGRRL